MKRTLSDYFEKKSKVKILIDKNDTLVTLKRNWLNDQESNLLYLNLLNNLEWKQEELFIYGRWVKPNRKTVAYGDEGLSYTYSGQTKIALNWTDSLKSLKDKIEKETQQDYNFVLIQYYPDGKSSIGWHSDDERDLEKDSIIASLSLGQSRKFMFKSKKDKKEMITTLLNQGDLLTMEKKCQRDYQHSLPVDHSIIKGRINLTFRKMKNK